METWLSATLIFAPLIVFLIFLFWLDWRCKCAKTIKENSLTIYLSGYAMLKSGEAESTLLLLNGILGVNSKELVFVNRFKDDSFKLTKDLSDVKNLEVYTYEENIFSDLIHNNFDLYDTKIKYEIVDMAGLSLSNRVPQLIKSRLLCKVNLLDDIALLFSYKNTQRNVEAIQRIKEFITK